MVPQKQVISNTNYVIWWFGSKTIYLKNSWRLCYTH